MVGRQSTEIRPTSENVLCSDLDPHTVTADKKLKKVSFEFSLVFFARDFMVIIPILSAIQITVLKIDLYIFCWVIPEITVNLYSKRLLRHDINTN